MDKNIRKARIAIDFKFNDDDETIYDINADYSCSGDGMNTAEAISVMVTAMESLIHDKFDEMSFIDFALRTEIIDINEAKKAIKRIEN